MIEANIKVIKSSSEMRRISDKLKSDGKITGFVPTMGFLHKGHLSLVKKCNQQSDITIVSIFVNPTQFAPNEDLQSYPRDIERDKKLLKENNVDYLFLPEDEEIYKKNFKTSVEVSDLTSKFEGEYRPTHFKGVTTVVAILFNIVNPNKVFFGQKDAQQVTVIKKMIQDLHFNIKLILCPIIREDDGLAFSSRNIYLSSEERDKAVLLSNSLNEAHSLISNGERNTFNILKKMNNRFLTEKSIHLNYIAVVDSESFGEADSLENGKSYFVLIAAKVGKTRLIDNLLVNIN